MEKKNRSVSPEQFDKIKVGNIVRTKSKLSYKITEATRGAPCVWGKELRGEKTFGNSRPLSRTDVVSIIVRE